MTQFDLMATPMTAAFQATPNLTPYTARPTNVALDTMNTPIAELRGNARDMAVKSTKPEYLLEDKGSESEKNRILWFAQRGRTPYPKSDSVDDDD